MANPIRRGKNQLYERQQSRMIKGVRNISRNHLFQLYSDGKRRVRGFASKSKPLASEVLTRYLLKCEEPPWTSYFVKYADVVNDQRGMSHFNWPVGGSNYHILRTGCFPYIKYHCTKRPKEDLTTDDKFYKAIKIINLGIPTLMYGLAATQLIRHEESVRTAQGEVTIYFLLPEDKGSRY